MKPATTSEVMCSVSAAQVSKIADFIEMKNGLISRARSGKHLSHVVLNEVCGKLDPPKGEVDATGQYRTYTFHEDYLDHLMWLVSEVWSVNSELADMVDQLSGDMVEIADAAFFAKQGSSANAA